MSKDVIDVLLLEVNTLKELIATEQDETVLEELRTEKLRLVAAINNRLGTDHIAPGSKVETIN